MTHASSGDDDNEPKDDSGSDDATRIITNNPSDDATRIIQPDAADDNDDEATRILPLKSPTPSKQDPPGPVIGVAQSSDPDVAQDENEDRTVFLPSGSDKPSEQGFDPAVGWLVITDGPGRGNHCPVFYGQNTIGRSDDQRIRLNFGDTRVARDSHAFIIYDDIARKFYLRDNGKANLVRHNNAPVMTPVELKDRDEISIGETVMMFVALCGENFDWLAAEDGPATGS